MILDPGFLWYEELGGNLEVLFSYPLRPKAEADNTLQDLPNFFFTMQKPNPVIAKRLSVALCFFYHIGILRHCKVPYEVHDG